MATYMMNDFGDGTYSVAFDDDVVYTTVTASGDAADDWVEEILRIHRRRLNYLVVGLDVEWRPCFESGASPSPVAVLQICVGRRCLVFQILHADFVPESLSDFLADDRFTFVGVGIDDDEGRLWQEHELELGNAVDLRDLAAEKMGKPWLRNAGLQNLVREVIGVHVEKPRHVRLSAWDAPMLSQEQVVYACSDAFASFEVGRRLIDCEY